MKHIFLIIACAISSFSYAKSGRELIAENSLKPSVAPLLTTHWSQDGGENSMLPWLYGEGSERAVTGCGATATAQIMCFWRYPASGRGDNYYTWEASDKQIHVLYADFQHTDYDWDNMIPVYKNNTSVTQEQIDAVSTLMLHIGTALEMKYDDTTPTQIEYIHTVLKKYFGYNKNSTLMRFANGAYSMDEWMTMIYKELSEGRPVLMGGRYEGRDTSVNHIFVADGYDEEGNVHLNLGKADMGFNRDTYYDLTRTDQTYTNDMRMIIGICPETLEGNLVSVNVTTPGTLLDALGGDISSKRVCRLKVTGSINSTDIACLEELSRVTTGQLSYIDLSDCYINDNALPESAFDHDNLTLQTIILPENIEKINAKAFRNCTGLYEINMPHNLKQIGNFAFSNCRYLGEISLPSTLNTVGRNPFRYDKIDCLEIEPGCQSFDITNCALVSRNGKILYSMPVKCLDEYRVENGVETIAQQAFLKSCKMNSLILPSSITQIQDNAFLQCYSLCHVFCYASVAPALSGSPFDAAISNCTLHVPEGCIDEYRQKGWTMFAQIVDDIIAEGINSITAADGSEGDLYSVNGLLLNTPPHNSIYLRKDKKGCTKKYVSR